MQVFQRDGFLLPSFKSKLPKPGQEKEVLTPLQAADFIAWEHRKSMKQVMGQKFIRSPL